MAAIELESLGKVYPGGVEAVKGVDLVIGDGEFVVLVGPSGCGKSTILRMIAGLERVSHGEIRIGGTRVNEREPAERDIAMVFQTYALYPHMSVRQNLAYGLRNRRMPKAEIARRIATAARILQLSDLLDRKPRALSGGQRQRVAMGRAIVREPAAFLFDEPLSNLDAKLRIHMRGEIKQLHRRLGTTSVYVTHDQLEAMTLADRLVVVNGGRIEQQGAPLDLYRRPATTFVAGFLGAPAMNLFDATVEAGVLRVGDAVLAPAVAHPGGR
ncbi:carbohydrate ABC transporter ATP-binding protein (CUT1 family) [Rhodovulum visakhapatnamense]|uniref:Carbohydrate ABC transporter ATP-binding protein (CUT1 family) n=1 Tax=Rhodovulum visakhapatnamense TaxID=364297 RepID=A0A4R8FV21_9RHOB|nr:carbohydrate ABC transporter ATP-binding protein (CUT1 family) [Rhodovulum visakhapatnamense]